MLRAQRIAAAGPPPCRGTVTLDFEQRHRRRAVLVTENGVEVLLDLPHAAVLSEGDALLLDDGGHIAVRAAVENCVELAAPPALLMRLAWHIGNRHFPAEIHADRILIPDDHVMVDMAVGLGAAVRRVRAPFDPERGAYGHHHDH